MLFNSIDFAIFLPIVFALYWVINGRNLRLQNGLIVTASYLFYGWWDWRFLALIVFSTLVDYLIGVQLDKREKHLNRKILLWLSIAVNLGFLGFFKYYNFFLDNFIDLFSLFGMQFRADSLKVILPVGISFYTFQTLSYTIDVYRKKIRPTKDLMAFAAFVSFFPQLVAGPIERASNLLPQFHKKRLFNYNQATDGLRQILWGLFKKIVIADNCAEYANMIFENSHQYSGATLVVGVIFFSFQIYGDFSGYSDIAIGTARLFGFNLKKNFDFPYFSINVADFWRRWHISLTTWFRDYLYIPLGGSKGSTFKKLRNTMLIFIVSGFWHGANWTFIAWGALNALFFLPLLLTKRNKKKPNKGGRTSSIPKAGELFAMIGTFALITFSWIFFRSPTIWHAFDYISEIFSSTLFSVPAFQGKFQALIIACLIVFFLIVEWLGREDQHALELLGSKWKRYYRWGFYYLLIVLMFVFDGKEQEFIYFQF